MKSKTHYETLGVPESSTAQEIKRAFRAQASKHHPDRNQGDGTAADRFKKAKTAYDVLHDVEQRAAYDKQLREQRAAAREMAERVAKNAARQASPTAARGGTAADAHAATSHMAVLWNAPRPVSPATNQTSSTNWGAVVAGGAAAVGLGVLLGAMFGGSSGSWDPSAQRYRGPDGRFRAR